MVCVDGPASADVAVAVVVSPTASRSRLCCDQFIASLVACGVNQVEDDIDALGIEKLLAERGGLESFCPAELDSELFSRVASRAGAILGARRAKGAGLLLPWSTCAQTRRDSPRSQLAASLMLNLHAILRVLQASVTLARESARRHTLDLRSTRLSLASPPPALTFRLRQYEHDNELLSYL